MRRKRPSWPRQAQAELARFDLAKALEEMPATERDVAVVAADLGLRARRNRVALGVDAKVHGRLAAAFAHRLQLDHRIRQREQRRRAGEELTLEVGAEAVAEDRNRQSVGDFAQLQHVLLRQELRLVEQDAVELAAFELIG